MPDSVDKNHIKVASAALKKSSTSENWTTFSETNDSHFSLGKLHTGNENYVNVVTSFGRCTQRQVIGTATITYKILRIRLKRWAELINIGMGREERMAGAFSLR